MSGLLAVYGNEELVVKIIKNGESFESCKPDIFKATYEKIPDNETPTEALERMLKESGAKIVDVSDSLGD